MVATIFPADRGDARTLARALLDAAGPDRHDEVTTVSQGALGIAYEVPEDLADAVLGTGGHVAGRSVERPGEVSTAADVGGSRADADGGSPRLPKATRARAGGSS